MGIEGSSLEYLLCIVKLFGGVDDELGVAEAELVLGVAIDVLTMIDVVSQELPC